MEMDFSNGLPPEMLAALSKAAGANLGGAMPTGGGAHRRSSHRGVKL